MESKYLIKQRGDSCGKEENFHGSFFNVENNFTLVDFHKKKIENLVNFRRKKVQDSR